MRVPSSPNQSANPSTPWEAEPVVEESGIVEDANAENLYLMGSYLPLLLVLLNTLCQMWCCYLDDDEMQYGGEREGYELLTYEVA